MTEFPHVRLIINVPNLSNQSGETTAGSSRNHLPNYSADEEEADVASSPASLELFMDPAIEMLKREMWRQIKLD